jgi:hypothetical protein
MKVDLMPLITGDDNVTVEPSYVWWAFSILSFTVMMGMAIFHGSHLDPQNLGLGYATILAGGGAGKMMGK